MSSKMRVQMIPRRTLTAFCAATIGILLNFGGPQGVESFAQGDPVIAAAGDIACDPDDLNFNDGAGETWICRMQATADLLRQVNPTAILLLGDNQYEEGTFFQYKDSYDHSWGRLKQITHPAAGNHEYATPHARGYFAYFGRSAGDAQAGYYSFDVEAWHLIVLNSNCGSVGGCQAGSAQERWLKADLAAHPGRCTLAYWHHPRFSSGWHGSDPTYRAFWQDLYQAGADVVLVGHDHDYERFAPQDPDGTADPARGIREFVVGTGGRSLYGFLRAQPNSEVRNAGTFGILVMTLHPREYNWKFVPIAGRRFTDSGHALCHLGSP